MILTLRSTLIFFILSLLFIQCKKDDGPSNPDNFTFDCLDLSEFKDFLNKQNTDNNILLDYELDAEKYILKFDDGAEVRLPNTCILRIDEQDWIVSLILKDSTVLDLGFKGKSITQIELNPFGVTPLSGRITIESKIPVKVEMTIISKSITGVNFKHSFKEEGKNLTLPILGLYPAHNNELIFKYSTSNGNLISLDTFFLQTEELPDYFPEMKVSVSNKNEMQDGFTLINYLVKALPNVPFMVDQEGEIRYFLDYDLFSDLSNLNYQNGLTRLKNGNFLFGDAHSHALYEVTVLGEVIANWPIQNEGYSFHHAAYEKPDGNLLLTVNKIGSIHSSGLNVIHDVIIELDRSSGQVVQEWDLKESLDDSRKYFYQDIGTNSINWFHGNSVIYDGSDNTIIVSGRLQCLVKLTYSNEVVWILAPHKKWGVSGNGMDLNTVLLDPLDKNGNLITDSLILNGRDSIHPDFEWNISQHSPKLLPNGNILLFDNGETRSVDGVSYSRVVEYEINSSNKTVKQVWAYGKERGTELFSRLVSGVQYLPEKENVLMSPGFGVENGGLVGNGGKVVEIDYNSKNVVFELLISSSGTGITLHNAYRLPIYPPYN